MMSPLRVQQGNHGKRQSDAEHDLADDERVRRGGSKATTMKARAEGSAQAEFF
jgi:hypothetical protein